MTEEQTNYDIEKFERRSPAVVKDDVSTSLVAMAMQKGYEPALIEKMMELERQNHQEQARRAYFEAMAAWKANAPEIKKDRAVGFDTKKGTKTSYRHASLFNVATSINKSMSPFGLHVSWKTVQDEKGITVTCSITHSMGHSESTSLTAGPDQSGNKNSIQAVGSTVTYLERYTVLALTGLATQDQDDDAKESEQEEFITEDQAREITSELKKLYKEENIPGFLEFFGATTVDTIPTKEYDAVMKAIAEAKKVKK